MRASLLLLLPLLPIGCQAPPAEMTDAEQAALIDSVAVVAQDMITAFGAEDPSYFDYYSDWAEYPAVSYPPLAEMPARIQASWWDPYEDRTIAVGEVKGRVLGPDAVALERIDESTATHEDGRRLEQRWVGRQVWVREGGAWKVLFEGFQMLGTREIE